MTIENILQRGQQSNEQSTLLISRRLFTLGALAWAASFSGMRAESLHHEPTAPQKELPELVVVLDPGHGGDDPGTTVNTYWEDEIVYDVVTRIQDLVHQQQLPFFVHSTVRSTDGPSQSRQKLTNGSNEFLNFDIDLFNDTIPRHYALPREKNADVTLLLRSFLTNRVYHHFLYQYAARYNPEGPESLLDIAQRHFVFTSFHGDCGEPNRRGLFVAVADPTLREKKLRQRCVNGVKDLLERSGIDLPEESDDYASRFLMMRDDPQGKGISASDMRQHYRVSQELGQRFIDCCREDGIVVDRRPIWSYLYDSSERYVPAVLTYSLMPCSLLIEVGNLNNPQEAAQLNTVEHRQRIAEAYVQMLIMKHAANVLQHPTIS